MSFWPIASGKFVFYGVELSVAGEVIAVALGLYLVLVALGRLFKRRFGVRLGEVYQLFCATTGPYLAIAALYPALPGRTELGALSALLGTGVLVRLIDQYFWRGYFEQTRKAPVPKFVRELTAAVLLLMVALLVLRFGYNQKDTLVKVLATSGVVGIVLGFAMQDSLGNIIAGMALQIGRPFQVGDWLLIDTHHARAIEINWRSTRFVTNDELQLDVPNQQIVRQSIVNYHGGGSRHAMRLEVGVDYAVPPNRVKELLSRAASSASGVLREPRPNVFLKSFGDSAINYEIRYWIDDHRLYNVVADAVRTNVWYGLHRHSIKMPFPVRTIHVERQTTGGRHGANGQADRHAAVCELLRGQPLFQSMGDEHLRTLVSRSPIQHFGLGEVIIHEGADGSSMFVLVHGEAGVNVTAAEESTRVATLRGAIVSARCRS